MNTIGRLVVSHVPKTQDWLEEMSPEIREKVIGFLQQFSLEMRGVRNKSLIMIEAVSPCLKETCVRCPLNPWNDTFPDFAPTAYNLAWALANDKFFLCNREQLEWGDIKFDFDSILFCNGFQSVQDFFPEKSKEIARKVILAIHPLLSGES